MRFRPLRIGGTIIFLLRASIASTLYKCCFFIIIICAEVLRIIVILNGEVRLVRLVVANAVGLLAEELIEIFVVGFVACVLSYFS